jgi:eukaryotic-like serine/threonine-protein kinase
MLVLPWIVACLSTAGLVAFVALASWGRQAAPGPVGRFSIPIGQVKQPLRTSLAISPDGMKLAYTADGQLFRRSMDELTPVRLGTGLQAVNSCFFAGSEWVGCGNQGRLLKVMLATGAPVALCDAEALFGAVGIDGDSIAFVPGAARGLWRVSSQGGERTAMRVPEFAKGERSYRHPAVLPGNRGLLFAMSRSDTPSFDDAQIVAYEPRTKRSVLVTSGGTYPRYASTGHLLFARAGNILAIAFDPRTLTASGAAKVVVEGILMDPLDGAACFDVSENGTLAYVPGGVISRNADIVWVDRNGNREPILSSEPVDRELRVSPDGTQLAFNKGRDIWVYNLALKTQVRITSDSAIDTDPVWSPDGQRITFASNRAGDMDIYERSADGTGPEVTLYQSPLAVRPMSWSPDGKTLIFEDSGPTTGTDVKLLSLLGDGKTSVREFAATTFNERQASFSPDGKWIVYVSDHAGAFEVYVQAADGSAGRRKISTDGGTEPLWNPRGGEIIYFKGPAAYSASVTTTPQFTSSRPRLLFKTPAVVTNSRFRNVDISRDGSRIAMMMPVDDPKDLEIRVVLNWLEELKRLAPIGGR